MKATLGQFDMLLGVHYNRLGYKKRARFILPFIDSIYNLEANNNSKAANLVAIQNTFIASWKFLNRWERRSNTDIAVFRIFPYG